MKKKIKTYTLEEAKNKTLGTKGNKVRDDYEYELQMEIIGELIKQAREEQNLTQAELGELVGVQKAQISRLEKHTGNVTLATIIKVFSALKTTVKFRLEIG